MTLKVDQGHR